ncbi:modular serine protease-like isoform X2 [Rhopalosiphum maidis]|uniref:modular serine protease-like isoform X2 n=1 Tax=Rhopalosiphum maidis TaxID=43146 RepID=UPI000EFE591B|nr:modular serine protease-like isoform X2 [Rhopalosiphum maidis]
MKVTYSWLIYSYLIFGIDVFCERILEKRQTVSSCKIADHYTCISGQCINKSSICDGTQDCNDGSDETLSLCETLRCENNKFRCKYGACVNMDSKCDGVQQCADGSDEKNCFGPISISADTSSLKLVNNTSELKTESNKKNVCILPSLEGVIYSYQGSDDILAHGTLINHNRTIIENCEIGYHKAYPNSFRVCQNNGTWTSKSEKLCFKCGRSYIGHQLLIDNGKKAQIGTAPWNVAVYRFNKENSKYDLICGGSLIAPNLIVSAAHCFWQNGMLSNRISINNGLYRIAVGKYYRNYTVIDNDFTQILDVETIYLQEDYYGYHRHYSHDIAVIVLSNRVNISLAVAAACVDWDGRYIVTNETQGKIVGWGITENDTPSPVLLEATLPYIDYNSCRSMYKNGFEQFVTFDKFCAGSASGQGVREGDSGAGLTFLHSDFYYLTGIVSLKDPNTKNSIAVFTNVRFYIKWLRELYNKYSSYESDNMLDTKNACVLPTTDGVIYSYEDSDKILAHGTLIKQHRVVIENCEVGYQKAYPSGLRICQGNGEWILNSKNLCFKKCPPLLSDSLDIKCTLNGNHVNCSSPSIPNTIANALCKLTRRLPNGQGGPPIELRCQSNGTWNNQLYECTTYCGRPYTRDQLLIDNGNTTAQVGTAPWNVGIYRFDKANSEYDLICGGSLIAPNLVVSAAHCFWNISMPRLFIVEMMKGSIKVAVGKFTRNYTVIDNEFTQMMDVKEIHLNRGYNGNDEARANDISVIVLKDKVTISAGVAPVCMDWNCAKVWQVPYGTRGKIVGWGKTENDTLSPVLLETTLSSIDQESCRMMYYGDKFQMFVTDDKFCAESKGGQGVHQTDSGAGLTFSHSDFYYLAGVLSVKDTNPDNPIVIFTDVLYHIEWLHDMYNKYIS